MFTVATPSLGGVLETATLDTLPATRRALLEVLKRQGRARADELAAALGITVSAVRQHLAALHGDGGDDGNGTAEQLAHGFNEVAGKALHLANLVDEVGRHITRLLQLRFWRHYTYG